MPARDGAAGDYHERGGPEQRAADIETGEGRDAKSACLLLRQASPGRRSRRRRS